MQVHDQIYILLNNVYMDREGGERMRSVCVKVRH